jgi:hypothetical protein
MADAADNNDLPQLAEACIRHPALYQRLSHFLCPQHGWHNLLREGSASVAVHKCLRECLTPGCHEHRPAQNATENFRAPVRRLPD